jgi:hypothetical protein
MTPPRKTKLYRKDVAWGYFYDNEYTKCRELCVYRVRARILLSRKMASLTKYRPGPIFKIVPPISKLPKAAGRGKGK